jgi:hypothetical protein
VVARTLRFSLREICQLCVFAVLRCKNAKFPRKTLRITQSKWLCQLTLEGTRIGAGINLSSALDDASFREYSFTNSGRKR